MMSLLRLVSSEQVKALRQVVSNSPENRTSEKVQVRVLNEFTPILNTTRFASL
jgi:hypothetical protein